MVRKKLDAGRLRTCEIAGHRPSNKRWAKLLGRSIDGLPTGLVEVHQCECWRADHEVVLYASSRRVEQSFAFAWHRSDSEKNSALAGGPVGNVFQKALPCD